MPASERFERAVTAALASGRASAGDDLSGFAIDVEHALARRGLTDVRVRKTDEPRRRLIASATSTADAATLEALLVEAWSTELRYAGPGSSEAHRVSRDAASTHLAFVTVSPSGLVVTGEIVVARAR